jgi:hypothetical protein
VSYFEQFAHFNFTLYSCNEKEERRPIAGLGFRGSSLLVGVISEHSSASLISFTHSILAA